MLRNQGGSGDVDESGVTVCRGCHLRSIHKGIVKVERRGRALVWRYPERVVVAL